MRPDSEYQEALRLISAGVNDCEVGRRLDIPRGTIKTWRVGLSTPTAGRTIGRGGRRRSTCFRCDGGRCNQEAYAYLLGAYLGDGSITSGPRGVYRLRVTCDLKYPGIIDEIAAHVIVVRGVERVGFAPQKGCVNVGAYWKHWPCVFPQHGPGRKHERKIELEGWQEDIVNRFPEALVRGLIHTDGTRHINEVTRPGSEPPIRYRYPRYQFTNYSEDIRRIFSDTLDALGVHWTQAGHRNISIARRADVAYLDTFVGPKR